MSCLAAVQHKRPALSPDTGCAGEQVWLEYAQHVGPRGLSQEGLRAMYQAGQGEVDDDFAALGLWINPQPSPPDSKPHSPLQAAEGLPSDGPQAAVAVSESRAEVAQAWGGRLAEWASAIKASSSAASSSGSPTADGAISITTSPAGGQSLWRPLWLAQLHACC